MKNKIKLNKQDVDNGFGGIASHIVELMYDEVSKATVLVYGVETESARDRKVAASRAMAFNALRSSASIYTPLGIFLFNIIFCVFFFFGKRKNSSGI